MNKQKTITIIVVILVAIILAGFLFFMVANGNSKNNSEETTSTQAADSNSETTTSENSDTQSDSVNTTALTEAEILALFTQVKDDWSEDTESYDEKFEVLTNTVNLDEYPDNSNVKIKFGGTYTISGTLIGKLTLRADGEVKLVFDNALIVNPQGDGINADNDVTIVGGKVTIYAYDDGIHSEQTVSIEDGTVNILKSYEALEALDVEISGGDITLTADDDGINGAGGNDETTDGEAQDPRAWGFGGGGMGSSGTGTVSISGGNITIACGLTGAGDGIDSNGDLYITGGTFLIIEPANAHDYSNLDYQSGFSWTGGTIEVQDTSGNITELTESNINSGPGGMGGGGGKQPGGW